MTMFVNQVKTVLLLGAILFMFWRRESHRSWQQGAA